VESLPRLAVRVQGLAQIPDSLPVFIGAVREGEGFEAAIFAVNWVIADTKPPAGLNCPDHMNSTGEDTKDEGVFTGDTNELMFWPTSGVNLSKQTVLCCF